MNQISLHKQKTIKYKISIITLSLIALICTVLSCVRYFVDFEFMIIPKFKCPSFFGFLFLLSDLIPCVIFTLYTLKFYKKYKAKYFLPIIFGLFAFSSILVIIESIVCDFAYDTSSLIIYIAQIIAFVLATISTFKGFIKKILPTIACCIGLVRELYYAFNLLYLFRFDFGVSFFFLFTRIISYVGFLSLFIAILIFILKIYPVLLMSPEKEDCIEKMPPEKALALLNNKLTLGIISEVEYQAKRIEIISKL